MQKPQKVKLLYFLSESKDLAVINKYNFILKGVYIHKLTCIFLRVHFLFLSFLSLRF